MTDKQTLLSYRLDQARETLADVDKMLNAGVSLRSVVNRAYYAMFYSILALFLHFDVAIRTSKHSGVISIFDQEFVHAGKIKKEFSRTLHRIFDARQEFDYRELSKVTADDALCHVKTAKEFLKEIERIIGDN